MRRLALVIVFAASAAAADDSAEPVPIELHATLAGATATLELRYRIQLPGPDWSADLAQIDLPAGGMVTDATVTAGGAAHALSLVHADDATFGDTLAAEPSDNRRWMFQLSGGDGRIDVGAAGPRAATFDLRMSVRVPACFERDRRYIQVPLAWKPIVPALAAPTTCGDGDAWMSFAASELSKRPSGERIGVAADALALDDHAIGRVELAVAGTLGDVPADLATAIVVDSSRSLGYRERQAIVRTVDAYVAAAPSSRVQVLAFARTTTPLLHDWTVASSAKAAIDHALENEPLKNGSNLDVALAEAATWLARMPGTHRVLVLTDARLANRIDEDKLRAGDALIHIVDVDDVSTLGRDDNAPLAHVALASGGIAVRAGSDDPIDATMLARPISLDHVSVSAPAWSKLPSLKSTCTGDLHEGGSCAWWGRSVAATPITVSGYVWGRLVSRVVQPDPSGGRDVARELAATSAFDGDPDADEVARAAFGVDRAWSLLATWGGTGGYADRIGLHGTHFGTGCGGCGDWASGTSGRGSYGWTTRESADAQLAHAVATCGVGTARVELVLELTRSEIVDVEATIVPAGTEPSITTGAWHDCIVDAVWNTDLVIPAPAEHQTRRLVIVGG